jgi:hypothetical protein
VSDVGVARVLAAVDEAWREVVLPGALSPRAQAYRACVLSRQAARLAARGHAERARAFRGFARRALAGALSLPPR